MSKASLLSAYDHLLPDDLKIILEKLTAIAIADHRRIALVGGVVRDLLLGRAVADADVMLEFPAEPLVRQAAVDLQAKLVSHPTFHTFTLHFPTGRKVDVVTAREETYPRPAALPVVRPSTMEKDLHRRDFSINAMACFLMPHQKGELLDVLNGRHDIDGRTLRALHEKSFEEDPTRIFRAARFAGRLGFDVDADTEAWINRSIAERHPAHLSPVRRRHEFEGILNEENPAAVFRWLEKWKATAFLHSAWGDLTLSDLPWPDPQEKRLETRLRFWFSRFTTAETTAQMTDLGFEKSMKSIILSSLPPLV